ELETADVSSLPNGWHWPEPVKMKAADSESDIYGVIFRPSSFCENKRYPVINMIVGGSWLMAVPHGSFHNSRGGADRYYFHGAALAELGFIVVVIDSRGTPARQKSFQDFSYGWIPDGANTPDHCGGIKQLAKRYPQMDLNRVGVLSRTGYHGGIQNLFECPDFYSVGVVFNMMGDPRLMNPIAEHVHKYQGLNGPRAGVSYPDQLAKNWTGKLLLVQLLSGGLTSIYPPAGTFRLIEAFRRANKDVDVMITPHTESFYAAPYEMRRMWDYLVKHLQGVEPPKEFQLGAFLP
ncbi:prolyl oligopeptidase family serine peptidase, partial [Porticoccaceae bacterium]|nr:prolyl oligopeptidase family serine peptidase [Porticoccaceae bacterium]